MTDDKPEVSMSAAGWTYVFFFLAKRLRDWGQDNGLALLHWEATIRRKQLKQTKLKSKQFATYIIHLASWLETNFHQTSGIIGNWQHQLTLGPTSFNASITPVRSNIWHHWQLASNIWHCAQPNDSTSQVISHTWHHWQHLTASDNWHQRSVCLQLSAGAPTCCRRSCLTGHANRKQIMVHQSGQLADMSEKFWPS